MSFCKLNVHSVWSTKYREPVLIEPYRLELFQHIKSRALSKGLLIDALDGYVEHVHCLFQMGSSQCAAQVIKEIKG